MRNPICSGMYGARVWTANPSGLEGPASSGTIKDLKSAALLDAYRAEPTVLLVSITSGNFGRSLGLAARQWEREHKGQTRMVVNLIPKGSRKLPANVRTLLEECSHVHEVDLDGSIITPEMKRTIAREASGYKGPDETIVDVDGLEIKGVYGSVVDEIAGVLGKEGSEDGAASDDEKRETSGIIPKYIFCPVGSAELAVQISEAAARTWGDKAPKIIGVTVEQSIIARNVKELPKPERGIAPGISRYFMRAPGQSIADKVTCGFSNHVDRFQQLVDEGKVELLVVSEQQIAAEYRLLEGLGIAVEPTSALAFVGARAYDLKPNDCVVIVNSGRGAFDPNAIRNMERRIRNRILRWIGAATTAIVVGLMLLLPIRCGLEDDGFRIETPSRRMDVTIGAKMQKTDPGRWWARTALGDIHTTLTNAQWFADKNHDSVVDQEELSEVCGTLPDCDAKNAPRRLEEFTVGQLDYYWWLTDSKTHMVAQGFTLYDLGNERKAKEYVARRRSEGNTTLEEMRRELEAEAGDRRP